MLGKFQRKTYNDSFLYNQQARVHDGALMELILKGERIDKSSDAFKEILYEMKRIQRSSILHTVLLMPDVVICYGLQKPMPAAFKVVSAKDIRNSRNSKKKIFIDASEIITYRNGVYTCKNMSYLISYLFNALIYLLYEKQPMKLINNSNITISSTECFVAMFDYILDYLRIIGYAENKDKISYLVGLYYLNHMVGKDLDKYSKNIAAKTAGIDTLNLSAYDLYYDETVDFLSIKTFIDMLVKNFKLKGLTLEVFINKWLYLYKNGTQYGVELYTSFLCIIATAYTGSYIVNQKQIERACSQSMVILGKSILQAGTDVFDNRAYMGRNAFESTMQVIDNNTHELRESVIKSYLRKPKDAYFVLEDFSSTKDAEKRANYMLAYYKETSHLNELSKNVVSTVRTALKTMPNETTQGTYKIGVLESILSPVKEYVTPTDKQTIDHLLSEEANRLRSIVLDLRDDESNRNLCQRCSKVQLDLNKSQGIL